MFKGPAGARRGGTLQGLLIILSVLGALTTSAVIVGPRYLAAESSGPPRPKVVEAKLPSHQAIIEDLGRLVGRSVGVLAIHPRGATAYEEIVLWLTDDDPQGKRGQPDEPELAVLSHSEVMQTITIYRMEAGVSDAAVGLSRDTATFCDRWRAHPEILPLVLARGVSEMRIERIGDPQQEWGAWGPHGGFQRLRLHLEWAADSTHGADAASVLVDTVMFPPDKN